jgi:hypothetical protein
MMHTIIYELQNHPYIICAVGGFLWWVFSNFMSHAAPLPPTCGWWSTSIHDFLQFAAANPYKFSFNQNPIQVFTNRNPTSPSVTSTLTVK